MKKIEDLHDCAKYLTKLKIGRINPLQKSGVDCAFTLEKQLKS